MKSQHGILNALGEQLAEEFEASGTANAGCSCHLSPPCSFCTHPGNPISLLERGDVWLINPGDELPDCPFCGSGEHVRNTEYHTETYDGPAIECTACEAIVKFDAWMSQKHENYPTEEELVNKILLMRNSNGNYTDERGVVNVKQQIREEIALIRADERQRWIEAAERLKWDESYRLNGAQQAVNIALDKLIAMIRVQT